MSPASASEPRHERSPVAAAVHKYYHEFQRGAIGELAPAERHAILRQQREQLISAATSCPNDREAPEALMAAADISSALDEPDEARRLLQEVAKHPRAGKTTKIMALMQLSPLWISEDLGQSFWCLNEMRDLILNLEPAELRRAWLPIAYQTVLHKSYLCVSAQEDPERVRTPLPPEDHAKKRSQYIEEYLNLLPELYNLGEFDSREDMQRSEANLLDHLARALTQEGDAERAVQTWEKLLQHPYNRWPATTIRRFQAEARYPDRRPEYLAALEGIEQTLPPDAGFEDLNAQIAYTVLDCDQGQVFLERLGHRIIAGDPRVVPPDNPVECSRRYASLARAYQCPDMRDLRQATHWYLRALEVCPAEDRDARSSLYLSLASVHERLVDFGAAAEWYERVIAEFPERYEVQAGYAAQAAQRFTRAARLRTEQTEAEK